MKPLNQDIVPSTINMAVELLYAAMEPDDIEAIKKQGGFDHFGFGVHLRNSWSIWDPETLLVQDFKTRFGLFGHGDDVSGMISDSLLAKVMGTDMAAIQAATAERIKKHWIESGIDPITGKDKNGHT